MTLLRAATLRRFLLMGSGFVVCAITQLPTAQTPAAQSQSKTRATKFQAALPGYRFQFPRDHGAHPAYQSEWWYYTGHLRSTNGRQFGYQLTFFRIAMAPKPAARRSKWAARDVIFAHFALTDVAGRRFFFDDRIDRAGAGLAGADAASNRKPPRIWLHDWTLRFEAPHGQNQRFRAAGLHRDAKTPTSFALDLTQRALKNPVAHGRNGVSQKSAGMGRASHYYSWTRLQSRGTLRIAGQKYFVTGQSWFDHEFGSSQLAPNQVGWDWFSLQLDDGRELMLYQLRTRDGAIDPFSSGTLIEKDGRSRHLKRAEFRISPQSFWRSPHSGGRYPSRWRVSLPRENLALDITPTLADQELNTRRSTPISYWEGLVDCRGTQNNRRLRGRGYVELTGYAKAFQSTF